MAKKKSENEPARGSSPSCMEMLDTAIRDRAAILQKSLAESLRTWATEKEIGTEDELLAIARCAFLPEGGQINAHPAIVHRITVRVLDRITNIH